MKKLFQNLGFQIKTINKLNNQNLFLKTCKSKKNFAFMIPSKTIKIPDEIKEGKDILSESELKKASKKEKKDKLKSNNYQSKFKLDPYDLDDYVIVGSEIFKNKHKEALIKLQKNEITQKEYHEMIDNDEVNSFSLDTFKYKENENSEQLYRRPFYGTADVSQIHMFTIPKDDKIEPYSSQQMFRYSAPDNDDQKLRSVINKRNNHISSFIPPFELSNQILQDIFVELKLFKEKFNLNLNDEEYLHKVMNDSYNEPESSVFIKEKKHRECIKVYVDIQNRLLEEISNINCKIIPNLVMKYVFELGFNNKLFWVLLEQEVLNNLHHFDMIELSKIFYAATFSCPKFTTDNFRTIIYNEVFNQLENCSLDEILHILFGFRETKNKKIYDKIANIIIAKKDSLVHNKITDISKLLYTYASHKPKKYGINTLNPQRELVEKVVYAYETDLIDNIMKMDCTELSRIATSLYLLRIENVDIFTK